MKSAPIDTFIRGEIEGLVTYKLTKNYDDRGWLSELFRNDMLEEEFYPTMAYVSFTKPGVVRGPHEHVWQADLFCILGPSTFTMRVWDNRKSSSTFGHLKDFTMGETNPAAIIIPSGVVHAYKNIGDVEGMVVNCPNRLYMGEKRSEPVDEIRHEDDPNTEFLMD